MKSKRFSSSFSFHSVIAFLLFNCTSMALAFQEPVKKATDSGISGGDIFNFVVTGGYLIGVLVLLPWIVYTNMKELIPQINPENFSGTELNADLSEEDRNNRAAMILEQIENKLTSLKENGEEFKTITKGSQARFIKKSMDYICTKLMPTDPEIIARANQIITVYEERTKRVFTGSKWIIGCAVGVGLLFTYLAGFSTFMVLHALGIVFYIMSSRTPMYVLEKRMKLFGGGGAVVGAIFGALFIGSGAKHYNIYSDGRKERDYESEFTGGMIYFLIIFVVAMFLGFLAAALGVVNFLMNYMNNALIPTKPETWYEKSFATA